MTHAHLYLHPTHAPHPHMHPAHTCTPPPHTHMHPTHTCTPPTHAPHTHTHAPHTHMHPTHTCTPPTHTCTPPTHAPPPPPHTHTHTHTHMHPTHTCTNNHTLLARSVVYWRNVSMGKLGCHIIIIYDPQWVKRIGVIIIFTSCFGKLYSLYTLFFTFKSVNKSFFVC